VTGVATRDRERLLRFVADAGDSGDDPFTPPVLAELGTLIPANWVGYDERDLPAGRCLLAHEHPDFEDVYGSFDLGAGASAESPLRADLQDGRFEANRLSDRFSRRALQRTSYYRLVLEPLGVTDRLWVSLPSPASHSKQFAFDRVDGTFAERDRLALELLQPHLHRLRQTAETGRRLRAALAGLEWAGQRDPRGVVLLGAGGRLEFASPAARRLLDAYFHEPSEHGSIPAAVTDWLEAGLQMLVCARGERRLTIHRAGDALLLEETRPAPPLTPREREVLRWVARGLTNAAIAELLWVAPSTVRKHLENVFAKLGVRTRTAAVARVRGLLDDTD